MNPASIPETHRPAGLVAGGLSLILIAKNEEEDLPGALESAREIADELVVVVDEASRDRSEDIARSFGAKVTRRRFDDYASQKEAALNAASCDWVLSLDADERLSEELRREIPRALAGDARINGYFIPFEVHFMGRRLRFGGLGSEKHLRLFRRAQGHFTGGSLHEGLSIEGPAGRLRGRIIHRPYQNLDEYLAKMNDYTSKAALKRYRLGARWKRRYLLLLPWELFSRLVLKLGLLDGIPGVVWAGLSAFHSWLKYAKLKELEEGWKL